MLPLNALIVHDMIKNTRYIAQTTKTAKHTNKATKAINDNIVSIIKAAKVSIIFK